MEFLIFKFDIKIFIKFWNSDGMCNEFSYFILNFLRFRFCDIFQIPITISKFLNHFWNINQIATSIFRKRFPISILNWIKITTSISEYLPNFNLKTFVSSDFDHQDFLKWKITTCLAFGSPSPIHIINQGQILNSYTIVDGN